MVGMRRTRSDPEAWKGGWKADAETITCAPRWTAPKCAKHSQTTEKWHTYLQNTKYSLGGGYRDTWVQVAVRKNRNPGPGHYKTDTELPLNKMSGPDYLRTAEGQVDEKNPRDEFNCNNTRKERAPKYSTLRRKELREASLPKLRLSCAKPSYLNTCCGPKSTDMMVTPGPGSYSQLTSFGAASGGHRKHFFPNTWTDPRKDA